MSLFENFFYPMYKIYFRDREVKYSGMGGRLSGYQWFTFFKSWYLSLVSKIYLMNMS